MAKAAGGTRTSKWASSSGGGETKLYHNGSRRVEYGELSEIDKQLVKNEAKLVRSGMYAKLKSVTTPQQIDNGVAIGIHYTSKGIKHFVNDTMLTLSGKYFSKNSMMRVNEILEKSKYVPTSHALTHARKDGRELWFSYSDNEGRGVYFKVNWNKNIKRYELYSVTDRT